MNHINLIPSKTLIDFSYKPNHKIVSSNDVKDIECKSKITKILQVEISYDEEECNFENLKDPDLFVISVNPKIYGLKLLRV